MPGIAQHLYQQSADGRSLSLLRMWAGTLTLAQSNWHPRRGEPYAQREGRVESRGHLAGCWRSAMGHGRHQLPMSMTPTTSSVATYLKMFYLEGVEQHGP